MIGLRVRCEQKYRVQDALGYHDKLAAGLLLSSSVLPPPIRPLLYLKENTVVYKIVSVVVVNKFYRRSVFIFQDSENVR